jgi:hypothetical protein
MNNLIAKFKDWLYFKLFRIHFTRTVARAREVAEQYGKQDGIDIGIKLAEKKLLKELKGDVMVDTESVFTVREDKIYIGNRLITETELDCLISEAKAINSFTFWTIVQETIKQRAIEKGMLKSTKWEEVLASKMMIFNLNIQRDILRVILNAEKIREQKR